MGGVPGNGDTDSHAGWRYEGIAYCGTPETLAEARLKGSARTAPTPIAAVVIGLGLTVTLVNIFIERRGRDRW